MKQDKSAINDYSLSTRQDGAVMILLAVSIVVILGIFAFIVDLGNIYYSRQQLSYATDHAALRALERFHELPVTDSYDSRLQAAATAASSIFMANKIIGVGSLGTLGPPSGVGTGPGTSGYIEPGAWLLSSSPTYGTCTTYPCFKSNPPGVTDVTSIRVVSQTDSTNPVRSIFAKVFGYSNTQLNAVSTASLKGRCMQVMIDVSASIIQRYHSNVQFAFRDQDWAPALSCSPAPCNQYISYEHSQFVNNVIHSPRPLSELNGPLNVFYESDFTLYPNPASPFSFPNGNQYHVYTRTLPSSPSTIMFEPLGSVLQGNNVAAQALNQRAVAGDSIGVIAFDDEVPGPTSQFRRIGQTNNFGLITQLTDVNNLYNNVHPNFVDIGFFTREHAQSNYRRAIERGREELNANCSPNSEKTLIMIGDGLVNCSPWLCGNAASCLNSGCLLEAPRSGCTSGAGCDGCGNSYTCFNSISYNLKTGPLVNQLKNDKISFHFIHVGDASAPNTRNCPTPEYWNCRAGGGSDATCAAMYQPFLDDDTWRTLVNNSIPFPTSQVAGQNYPLECSHPANASFVSEDGPSASYSGNPPPATQWQNASPSTPFFGANQWIYNKFIKELGGVYCPIRREPANNCLFDGTSSTGNCDCVADSRTPSGKRLRNSHYLPADIVPPCIGTCSGNCCDPAVRKTRLAAGPYSWYDYLGNALRVDPYCRTSGEQITDCLLKILAGDPFKLVEENP